MRANNKTEGQEQEFPSNCQLKEQIKQNFVLKIINNSAPEAGREPSTLCTNDSP